MYFNHYITFEICELRLYVSLPFHLPGLLISVIPPSTPVCKYSPSSRWEQAFPFRRFEGGLFSCVIVKVLSPRDAGRQGVFEARFYTEAIVCLPIKPVYGGYIVLSDGFQKWASPGKTRPDIKTDLLMRTMHISPPWGNNFTSQENIVHLSR